MLLTISNWTSEAHFLKILLHLRHHGAADFLDDNKIDEKAIEQCNVPFALLWKIVRSRVCSFFEFDYSLRIIVQRDNQIGTMWKRDMQKFALEFCRSGAAPFGAGGSRAEANPKDTPV